MSAYTPNHGGVHPAYTSAYALASPLCFYPLWKQKVQKSKLAGGAPPPQTPPTFPPSAIQRSAWTYEKHAPWRVFHASTPTVVLPKAEKLWGSGPPQLNFIFALFLSTGGTPHFGTLQGSPLESTPCSSHLLLCLHYTSLLFFRAKSFSGSSNCIFIQFAKVYVYATCGKQNACTYHLWK